MHSPSQSFRGSESSPSNELSKFQPWFPAITTCHRPPHLTSPTLIFLARPELKKRTHKTIVAEMPSLPFAWLGRRPFQLSRLFRELEQDVEMVVKVLQPGPLGIVEHKFSAEEIQEAKTTVERSIENWRRIAALEKHGHVLKDGEK